MQILSKLDTLIAGQKNIENRLLNLEKKLDQNNNDMIDSDGIKVILLIKRIYKHQCFYTYIY
jgi:hypothetical protein